MVGHYLVTGGAGFVGTHLVERLLDAGCKVTIVDDFSTGNRKRLENHLKTGRLRLLVNNICDRASLKQALAGVDGVFHLAAKVSIADCIKDWLGNHSINGTALLGLFDLVREGENIPVVYASSAAVYGDRNDQSCNEEMVERPISPSGTDKLSCENHARAFWAIHGIPSVGLRFFNIYGPGQNSESPYAGVLTRFVRNIEADTSPEIHGDGLQSRDFVHISNSVDALVAAMARISLSLDALVCNVCTGVSHAVQDIAFTIAKILQISSLQLAHLPARAGDIRHSCGDPAHMENLLDLGPFITLDQGLSSWLARSAKVGRAS